MANNKPKVIFLSLPMSGRTEEECLAQIEQMKEKARNINQFYEGCVDNLGCNVPDVFVMHANHPELLYLGKAIQIMSSVDAVMMGEGWVDARGCMIEFTVARKYGIPIYDSEGKLIMEENKNE